MFSFAGPEASEEGLAIRAEAAKQQTLIGSSAERSSGSTTAERWLSRRDRDERRQPGPVR